MGTPFPYVPAAFQQWERRSHAFPLEMTPGPYTYPAETVARRLSGGFWSCHSATWATGVYSWDR